MPLHFFTSITSNYIPKARVLASSVKVHNTASCFHLILADKIPKGFDVKNEPFDTLLTVEDLDIENLDAWIFKHSVVELCTAIKGRSFLKLFEITDATKLVYLDPDIVVLSSLEELSKLMDFHDIVLVPHQVEPDNEYQAIIDNEICSLKHGVFNLGFLAVTKSHEGLRFLTWWTNRLLDFCYDDIPNGLFTDQRWVDLAPCFFNVHILRDKSYNVATWNLTHRHITKGADGTLLIDDSPIKFFHFSGFDSGAQEIMLKKYAPPDSPLFELRDWYINKLESAGQNDYGSLSCCYEFYSNGEYIGLEERRLYRSRLDLMKAFPRPAQVTDDGDCYYWWYRKYGKQEPMGSFELMTDGERLLFNLRKTWLWKLGRRVWMSNGILRRLLRRTFLKTGTK